MRANEFGQPIGDAVDWAGATHPQRVSHEGRYVRLEPVGPEHAQQVVDNLGELSLWTYRPDLPPTDVEAAKQAIAGWAAATQSVTFAIVPRRSGEVEGLLSYWRIDAANGTIEVAAVLYSASLKQSREATEAQYLLLRHAFEDLGYRRYEWKCDSLNAPSRRAAARLGFVEEGTWRQALVYKGRNRDTTWFSITDAEWPRLRAAYDAWLDPANFDPEGRQLCSLSELRGTVE